MIKIRHEVKVILIAAEFSTYAKFRGNIKITWQRENSAAWLEIPRPAKNSGP